MFKFDYRQFEPEPRDLDERARVHWLPFIEAELVNRYRSTDGRGQEIIGHSLLLNSCTAYWGFLMSMIPKSRARSLSQFSDWFFSAVHPDRRWPRPPLSCVFISHQRSASHLGERVTCLADHHGIDYWLDIHDPTLTNQQPNERCVAFTTGWVPGQDFASGCWLVATDQSPATCGAANR